MLKQRLRRHPTVKQSLLIMIVRIPVATSLRKSKTVLIRKGEEMKKIDKLKFEKMTTKRRFVRGAEIEKGKNL